MFSTADRFEKEATEDSPGPGQYDLPSTLEGDSAELDCLFFMTGGHRY